MKTKHIFVPALDVGELLPFAIRRTKTLKESIEEQERAKKELLRFIDRLEKNYRKPIFYMGMDVIEAKNYERFIFEDGGFFEIMIEAPLAMNAHFVHKVQAQRFLNALKKTLKEVLKKEKTSDIFINSIEVNSEQDQSLTYEEWDKIKHLK